MAMPTLAQWYPLFVVADLPNDIINDILTKAANERNQHDEAARAEGLFDNRWVLIKSRDQKDFFRPTVPPIDPFESEFIGASIDEIGSFIKKNFGEGGLGQGPGGGFDYCATEVFGILDSRTAEDDTILFVVEDSVDLIEDAQVRVGWKKSTKFDEALLRYSENEATKEDMVTLIDGINDKEEVDSASKELHSQPEHEAGSDDVERLKIWYEKNKSTNKDRWFEFRLRTDRAFWCIGGILYRGALDYMLSPENDFDENGVMKVL